MFEWRFGGYEFLGVMVALVHAKEIFGTEKNFDKVMEDYNDATVLQLYMAIQKKDGALQLFDKALGAIKKKKIKSFNKPDYIEKNPALAKIDPLKFMRWAEQNHIEVPHFLHDASRKKEAEIDAEKARRRHNKIILECEDHPLP